MLETPRGKAFWFADEAVWQRWGAAVAGTLAVWAVLLAIGRREVAAAVHTWFDSTAYNHCFLIVPVALYIAWQRKGRLPALAPETDLRALLLLPPLTLLWLVADRLNIVEAQQLALMGMMQAAAFAIVGGAVYRAFLTPFLYLFFLVPTGYFLVPWLQDFTAWFVAKGLTLLQIPTYTDGIYIEIPAGQFVVAEACAGLRFLVASVAFGVLFAALMYRSRVRWTLFMLLSFFVPIVANGMRALMILLLAEWIGNTNAVMADHIIYGWGFFTFVTFLLIVIGFSFADRRAADDAASEARGVAAAPAWRVVLAGALGLALAASGPAYAGLHAWQAGASGLADVAAPPTGPDWHPVAAAEAGWKPAAEDATREFLQTFSDGRDEVTRFVALYPAGAPQLAHPQSSLAAGTGSRVAAGNRMRVAIGGADEDVMTANVSTPRSQLVVFYFYVVNGRFAGTSVAAKFAQMRGLFGGHETPSAFVALAAKDEHGAGAAAVQRFIAAMPSAASFAGTPLN